MGLNRHKPDFVAFIDNPWDLGFYIAFRTLVSTWKHISNESVDDNKLNSTQRQRIIHGDQLTLQPYYQMLRGTQTSVELGSIGHALVINSWSKCTREVEMEVWYVWGGSILTLSLGRP